LNIINLLSFSETVGDFHAASIINSTGLVSSSNTTDYKAGVETELRPLFEVELGAEFNAVIEPCVP